MGHQAVGEDGEVAPLAGDAGGADGDAVLPFRDVHGPVGPLVLEEEDGVGVFDGGGQEPLGVGRGAGDTTFSPGTWAKKASTLWEW